MAGRVRSWLAQRGGILIGLGLLAGILLTAVALAETYVADLGFITSQTIYTTNERIELQGTLTLSNYSSNGSIITNRTPIFNATVNISLINKTTGNLVSSTALNTSSIGQFYSRSDFFSAALLISAPATVGDYYLRANYTDPANVTWFTQVEIHIVNQTVDRLVVSSDKLVYSAGAPLIIIVEALRDVGDRIVYIENISANGSIRDADKTILSSFNCTTGSTGKCTVATTASSSVGFYYLELENFKAFSTFEVAPFTINLEMKDEFGTAIKHIFDEGEQASIEVGAITSNQSDVYTFDGVVRNSANTAVLNITSTTLNSSNSFTNRFTTTLDGVHFPAGSYVVYVNVTRSTGGIVRATTSFQVRSWGLYVEKRATGSGFAYEYSAYPGSLTWYDIIPTWRANGSVVRDINISSINISLIDLFNNPLSVANATFNATCRSSCYQFNLTLPTTAGEYSVSVIVSHNNDAQHFRRRVRVVTASMFAQSTDKDGSLKELFGTNELVYLSLSAENATGTINLSSASVVSVIFMNGTESNYTEQATFELVNTSNGALEWAWNSTLQRIKLDTPKAGGVYNVHLTGQNGTAATSTRFIINPYDVCVVPKSTAGQVTNGQSYYLFQFKTSDVIYLELKVTQADNPLGRAASFNTTESNATSQYGLRSACSVDTQTQQVVNNATITISKVVNTLTGKVFTLNSSETFCQADDNEGGYTCTITPVGNWDGGGYGVTLEVVSADGQISDMAHAAFEARSFYLYAYSTTYQNKPTTNITLTVYIYEAGNNWWGSIGSGGLSGTVSVEKIEYQGRDGEWIWPPIAYPYNISLVNTSQVTNGGGTISLPAANAPSGVWDTGYYRAVLKGIDNGGNVDYGYAWFGVKRWEVYASPVECIGTSCSSTYNINAKNNITLYVTITNAGQWGQTGQDLGSNVTISVKKIQDCRKWPCSDYNTSKYNATSITVTRSSGWYWSSANTSYLLNINVTPGTTSWNTGYWQVLLDVNGSETGRGWFNTVAFYVEARPTDSNGTNWKYSIKNNESMYFYVTATKTQKGGYFVSGYNTSDYLNVTIDSSILRRWDQVTQRMVELRHPTDYNITILGGGSVINGTRTINFTPNGNWSSGYYWGELTLENLQNETATAWLWFQVRPFRVDIQVRQYSIDNDACVNGTLSIYEPDWRVNTVLNGTYNISGVTERVYSSGSSTLRTYTNFTPSGTFSGNTSLTICPAGSTWPGGSWGNYHYLAVQVRDSAGNSDDSWLSFQTIPFQVRWGGIIGGSHVLTSANVVLPANVTKATSGAATTGNLSKVYQWRFDSWRSVLEEYNFSVGGCDTRTAGVRSCAVNGTQNVTIYAPSGGWKVGYNYLQSEWSSPSSTATRITDWTGFNFNGISVYTGWWDNVNASGSFKSAFALNENITIRLNVRDTNGSTITTVNVTGVEYALSSNNCWSDSCRQYTSGTYSLIDTPALQLTGSAILTVQPPTGNWTRGTMYLRATVSGVNGTATITSGSVTIRDTTPPKITILTPQLNATVNSSTFDANWTTTEASNCRLQMMNYNTFNASRCMNTTVANPSACNNTLFSGSGYYLEVVDANYRSRTEGASYSWGFGSTGLVTGGVSHSYIVSTSNLSVQHYAVEVTCSDVDWNNAVNFTTILVNVTVSNTSSTSVSNQTNVTLLAPANLANRTTSSVHFNYSVAGPSTANCSLYGNFSNIWALNKTSALIANGTHNFTITLQNTTYLWNVYCTQTNNVSNNDWGGSNRTLQVNASSGVGPSGLLPLIPEAPIPEAGSEDRLAPPSMPAARGTALRRFWGDYS